MKSTSTVQVRTPAGLVDAPSYYQWKQGIGGMDFVFTLHIAAGHPKGFVAPLAISELETGFDTKATIRHPKTGAPLSSSNIQGLKSNEVKAAAKAALHNLIHKRIGAGRFLQAMLGAQMQISKVDLSKYEYKGHPDQLPPIKGGLAKPGTATFSTTATPEQAAVLDQLLGSCEVCNGSKVVSTTDVDHEGNNIEITCPACIPKAIELPETPVSQMGGVGYRFDVAMTPGDPAADQYIPSPEEAAAALEDAATMNDNMAKHGTIDAPTAEQLRERRSHLQERADQHGTMTGDTSEGEYGEICEEIDDLTNKIADLEGKPCSN